MQMHVNTQELLHSSRNLALPSCNPTAKPHSDAHTPCASVQNRHTSAVDDPRPPPSHASRWRPRHRLVITRSLFQAPDHNLPPRLGAMQRPSTSLPQLSRSPATPLPTRPRTNASHIPPPATHPSSPSKPHIAISLCPPDMYPALPPTANPTSILAPFSHMPATARSASLAAMCHVVQGATAIIQSPGDLAAMHAAIHERTSALLRCARAHVFIVHGESRGKPTLHTLSANGHATTITAYDKRSGLLGATAAEFVRSAAACDPLAFFGGSVVRVEVPEDHALFDDSVDIVPSSGLGFGVWGLEALVWH